MHPLAIDCIVHFTNFTLHNLFLHITACMVLMLPRTCTMHVTDVAESLLLCHRCITVAAMPSSNSRQRRAVAGSPPKAGFSASRYIIAIMIE